MPAKKTLLAINGSASQRSSNERLIDNLADLVKDHFDVVIYDRLKTLPHFDPQLSGDNPPEAVVEFRDQVAKADCVVICTPEYIFSIPSGLKNALEWCVATTVFSDKPTGIITASAHGEKGHDELRLIMNTIMAKFTDDTTLLIAGIKGKITDHGEIIHRDTNQQLRNFANALKRL